MNFNTKEYELSILKKIDISLTEAMEKLASYTKIKNEDKTPEELFEQVAIVQRMTALKLM